MSQEKKEKLRVLPLADWLRQYPGTLVPQAEIDTALEQYGSLMIKNNRRLRNSTERLEYFGGIEELKRLMAEFKRNRASFAILLGCQVEPITGYELTRFCNPLDVRLGLGTLYRKLKSLLDSGAIERHGLLYVYKERSGLPYVVERGGYQTTEEGFRQKDAFFQQEPNITSGHLVPVPS